MTTVLFLTAGEGILSFYYVFMMILILVVSIALIFAPLFIWKWCKHTCEAVEANTVAVRSLIAKLEHMPGNLVQVALNQQKIAEIVAGLHETMPDLNEHLNTQDLPKILRQKK